MVTRSEPGPGLTSSGVVAIIRDRAGVHLRVACEALLESGIPAVEVTSNTPGALEAIAALVEAGATEIGMGTVRTVEQVDRAVDAGATFIVTPSLSTEVGAAVLHAGLRWYPGAATPTEIETAWRAAGSGASVMTNRDASLRERFTVKEWTFAPASTEPPTRASC